MHKLIYFDWAGRAEAIRDALRIGQIVFKDIRLSYQEFSMLRNQGKFPYDVLPVLELSSGTVISQSNTILRWAAHQAKLCPQTVEDLLLMESMLDAIEDYATRLSVSIRVSDLKVKTHLRSRLNQDCFPKFYQLLTRHLNIQSSQHLLGHQLTVADLKAYHFIDKLTNGTLDGISVDALNHYPILKAWFGHIDTVRRTHNL